MTYLLKRIEDLKEGEDVVAFGAHVVKWRAVAPGHFMFDGEATYAVVPAPRGCPDWDSDSGCCTRGDTKMASPQQTRSCDACLLGVSPRDEARCFAICDSNHNGWQPRQCHDCGGDMGASPVSYSENGIVQYWRCQACAQKWWDAVYHTEHEQPRERGDGKAADEAMERFHSYQHEGG
jgi:hypothetical protein